MSEHTNGSNHEERQEEAAAAPESSPDGGTKRRSGPAGTLKGVAILGDYLPRQCGIATFTSDLSHAIMTAQPGLPTWVVAMNDLPEGYRYPGEVRFEVNDDRIDEYRLAAEYLNISPLDVISVQHEYGIFGGPAGSYVIELLRELNKPVVSTLHTVLKDPDPLQKETLRQLASVSDRMVVMSHTAEAFLQDVYGVPEEKVVFIPHGIPDMPFIDPNFYKDKFGVAGKKVILTFGLLSPGKGIEYMIDALPHVVEQHPDAVYIVLGATHPHVRKTFGEDYRLGLQRRARENGVDDNIIFHNRFVELDELLEFLGAADVYVTPYLGEAQVVSGTLAYAMGTGNATVSTPYWYAREMLAEERGVLVPFKDPEAMAGAINDLFENEVERHAMRKRAYLYCRDMIWPEVGRRYIEVFEEAVEHRRRAAQPAAVIKTLKSIDPELPEVRFNHLELLTDDTSILQHARWTVPHPDFGYCSCDTGRALLVAAMAQQLYPHDARLRRLSSRYLAFLQHAWNPETQRFRNFLSYARHWEDEAGTDDSNGRVVWGLGGLVAYGTERGQKALAVRLFQDSLIGVESMASPRAWAYSLCGIHTYLRRYSGDTQARRVRELLALRLFDQWQGYATDEWPWLEDRLTYANGKLPQALLLSGQWMYDESMIELGLKALRWLADVQTTDEGYFAPIGNDGWYIKGGPRSRFDQQPLEASNMVEACLEAYNVTQDRQWLVEAHRAFNWFLGANDGRVPVYDHTTGGCCDGLGQQGVNDNQGAESTLTWLIALLTLHMHRASHSIPAVERAEVPEPGPEESPAR